MEIPDIDRPNIDVGEHVNPLPTVVETDRGLGVIAQPLARRPTTSNRRNGVVRASL
jgi:hypothetical protein